MGDSTNRQMGAVRGALQNSGLRRVLAAYMASCISEWALWLALIVYAYDEGGASVAGFVTIGLFVPGALIAPFAGSAADGPRPNRVLTAVYAVQAVTLAVASILAYTDGPLMSVVAPAAVALTVVSYIRPCISVVVPGLVTSAGELTAANVLIGFCDSSSVLGGPLIASALIALDGPRFMLAVGAGLALLGVVLIRPLIASERSEAFDVERAPRGSRTGMLIAGLRSLGERKGALPLLAVLTVQFMLVGALDLILVVLANEQFDLGPSGPAILGVAFGVGAVLGAGASALLVGRQRLAPVAVLSLAIICVALVVLAGATTLVVALVVLPVAGLSRSLLNVTGNMLMQRAAPQDALASIFATIEALCLVCGAAGSVIVHVVVAASGIRAAIMAIAVVMTGLLSVTAKRLVEVDSSADAPVVAVRLLKRIPLFAPLPGPALEALARAAHHVAVERGTAIIHEGEPGDSYFAIVTGEVDVDVHGTRVRTMVRGQGFGEIALLADVARTGTVVAATDVELLEIHRAAFLAAVTGHDVARRAAWGVARTWHPEIDDAPA